MSSRIFSEEDIKTIHSIVHETVLDGNSCIIEPFDSTTLLLNIPSENHFVLEPVSQKDAVVQFTAWLVFLLAKSVNDMGTDISSIANDTTSQQFSSFFRRLKEVPRLSIEEISTNIINWFEYTGDLVHYIEYFYHDDFILTTSGWGVDATIDLLYSAMERDKERAFDELADKYYGREFLDVALYNFWGDNFSSKLKSINFGLPLTSEEKEIINNKANRNRMLEECRQLFITDKLDLDIDLRQATLFFERLFKDYISRIRETIQDTSVLPFASKYWEIKTLSIMGSISRQGLSLEQINLSRYNSVAYSCCYQAILDVCAGYLIQLTPGSHYCAWSASIMDLGIPYVDLYDKMTTGDEKFFIPSSLSLNSFRRGFEEANFKPLYVSVEDYCKKNGKAKSGKLGCIKYLVSELGNQLGEEWFIKAAESICDKKDSDAKNYMRNHTDTLAIKSFSRVLHDTIPTLSHRKKKKRMKD